MFIYDNIFLSQNDCDEIIKFSKDQGLTDSTVTTRVPNFRTSQLCYFKHGSNTLVDSIYSRVSGIVNLPIENIEPIQVNRYSENQYFLPHFDFLPHELIVDTGGQRLFTFLLYLNSDFIGGQTRFPNIDVIIQPNTGQALAWRNCLSDSNLIDHNFLHESMPVSSGEKWILVAWIRESKYTKQVSQTTN